jgi:hypothetical protein
MQGDQSETIHPVEIGAVVGFDLAQLKHTSKESEMD